MATVDTVNDTLLCESANGIATVTLNRPKRVNALDPALVEAMTDLFPRLETDAEVRVVVVRGAGGNFMAGGDIKMFREHVELEPEARRRRFEQMVHALHPCVFSLRRMPKPVIALVEGACAGAGISFMLACDVAVAARSSTFCMAYTMLGTSPDGSSTYSLPRAVGLKKAMQLALLNERISAEEAERIGLVSTVVDDAEVEGKVAEWAMRLAFGPTRAFGHAKRLLNGSFDHDLGQQLLLEAEHFADCAASEDFAEGVKAFVGKRMPTYRGR